MKKILVVDDEALILESLKMGLESVAGWQVIKAHTGHAGYIKALAEQPDVILLDGNMPEMDGAATLKLLKQNVATRDIPVIMLTATSGQEDLLRALQAEKDRRRQ